MNGSDEILTVFDKSEHGAVLQTHIHVDVLNVHIHIANSALIVLALGLEVLDHRLKLVDFFKVTLDAARIPI